MFIHAVVYAAVAGAARSHAFGDVHKQFTLFPTHVPWYLRMPSRTARRTAHDGDRSHFTYCIDCEELESLQGP